MGKASMVTKEMPKPFNKLSGTAFQRTTSNFVRMKGISSVKDAIRASSGIKLSSSGSNW